ncbi:MAG: flagellar assembly protein FliW [Deltaproteobacteria bacterium]|nr:flagellar assembly protein FliW [Deltaproteobacteria bacterium]
MEKIHSRFGEIEYDPAQTLLFPEGLIGFEKLRRFVVIPNKKEGLLFWIQSVEDADVAFIVTDPTHFFLDYKVVPDQQEQEKLGIADAGACFNLVVVTVHPDKAVTFNLAAPILFAAATNCALQVILEGTNYQPRTPLPNLSK